MLLNESAARKKWCPHARVEGNNRLHNMQTGGVSPDDAAYLCLGSDCMSWREFHLRFSHGDDFGGEKRGYCGLSGHPELE